MASDSFVKRHESGVVQLFVIYNNLLKLLGELSDTDNILPKM